ncbi:MAG: saccharopine dehydrogenase NADP-binding domain-containing protein [Actinomycetota bacterium]|nr:saccharopine dehydrogenase NADP-binding domain-containing protein [Actinomycetota bacterium]
MLGAGRQGTAAAFDLVTRGDATSVAFGDADTDRAGAAAARVNALTGTVAAHSATVDASEPQAVTAFLEDADAAVSAVPYWLNLGVSRAALSARTHVCDLGGNMKVVRA